MMTEVANASAGALRIGVILDSLIVPAWTAKIIRDIQASGFARIILVMLPAAKKERILQRIKWRALRFSLFQLYEKLDSWLVKRLRSGTDAFERVDIRADVCSAALETSCSSSAEPENAAAQATTIRSADAGPDLLLDLRVDTVESARAARPKYGVWRLQHGNDSQSSADAPLFAETYERNPVSESSLQVFAANFDGPRTIYRSFSSTNFVSLYRTRSRIYWKSAEFVMRRLRDLRRYGWDYICALSERSDIDPSRMGGLSKPTSLTMVRFLLGLLLALIGRRARALLFREQWVLAVRGRGAAASARGWQGVRLIIPPADRFYADPFIYQQGDKTYVFFEDFRFKTAKGLISFFEIGKDGKYTEPEVVLERDYHLSYPCLFEWQGETYLLPETGANRTVELYRSVEFPRRWERERVLMENIEVRDATLAHHGGRFWLFALVPVEATLFDELHLFSADSPLGPWHPHPKNPVVSDVRRARPAGRLFRVNGQLFRPGQDCSIRYGHAIVIHRIEVLSEEDYREYAVRRIDPEWFAGNLATHTLNRDGEFEVLDAKLRLLKNPLNLLFRARQTHSVRMLPVGNLENQQLAAAAEGADRHDASIMIS
jgi:hypothetical protein